MLRELFRAVLNLSLLGLPLMAAVLLLRRLLRAGVPRRGLYFLWALVFLRLMLPAAVSSPMSFYNLLPKEQIVQRGEGAAAVILPERGTTVEFPVLLRERGENPGIDAGPPGAPGSGPDAVHPVVARRPVDLTTILATVWACGVLMLVLFGAFCYLLVLHRVKRESFPLELPGFRAPPGVRVVQSGLFHTPIVCGLLRPVIVLPMEMDTEDAGAMRSVLAHEQAHIRRRDNLWRLLASFTVYLHWFNPLAWVCYCGFIRDMEVSCDERVLASSPGDIRTQYAAALLSLASSQVNPLYGGMLSFGESGIKERVKHIMSFQRAKLFAVILCAAVAVGLALVFLTNPSAGELPVTASGDASEPGPTSFAPLVRDPASQAESGPETEPAVSAPQPEPEPQPRPAAPVPQPPEPAAPPAGAQAVVEEVQREESGPEGREIHYNGSRVTHLFVFDQENASYRPVVDPFDQLELIYACSARKSTAGSGQVVIHTETERYDLSFDLAQDEALARLCAKARENGPHIIQWIGWMNDNRLIRASYGDAGRSFTTIEPAEIGSIAGFLKRLEVEPAPEILTGGVFPVLSGDMNYSLTLDFASGLTYKIIGDASRVVIWTNRTGDLVICYTLADPPQREELQALIGGLLEAQEAAAVPGEVAQVLPPEPGDIRRVNLYRNAEKTFVSFYKDGHRWKELAALLRGARTAHAAVLGQPLAGVSTLEVTRESDLAKFTYRLYEHGFTVEGTAVEGLSVSEAYALPSAALWELFCNTLQEAFDAVPDPGAYWLGLMSEAKIEKLRVRDNATGAEMEAGLEIGLPVIDLLRSLPVDPQFTSIDPAQFDEDDPAAVTVWIDFKNGVRYRVSVGRELLRITSSDMSYGLQYQLVGEQWRREKLAAFAAEPPADSPA